MKTLSSILHRHEEFKNTVLKKEESLKIPNYVKCVPNGYKEKSCFQMIL